MPEMTQTVVFYSTHWALISGFLTVRVAGVRVVGCEVHGMVYTVVVHGGGGTRGYGGWWTRSIPGATPWYGSGYSIYPLYYSISPLYRVWDTTTPTVPGLGHHKPHCTGTVTVNPHCTGTVTVNPPLYHCDGHCNTPTVPL